MARVDLQHDGAGRCVIVFQGRWTLHDTVPSVGKLALRLESDCRGGAVSFSCAGLTAWDSRFLTFCRSVLETLEGRGIAYDTSGLPDGVLRLLSLAAQVPEREGAAVSRKSPLSARMGEALHAAFAGTISVMEFIGDVTLSVLRMCIGRAVFRWSDTFALLRFCGAQSLPIVSLISMLAGLIFAFVGAVQLKMFGAEIYVASLVGIAMLRVMGAVMTAIIVSGRVGAAFAAELGTMQVNEEIDAFSTFGISPLDFLVLPRMLALVLMMPLLCVYANLMGIVGGAAVGWLMLDINLHQYFNMTWQTVSLTHFGVGIAHSVVFGFVVAVCSCYMGIHCGRSASAVGKATTSAVVSSIVSIVVATAVITFLCNILGI
ncbi:protein of unknown function DUF140 [Oleidesulfovibrio alaskensis G20]|jgi:phospholipid/cholesterol/gamma-HCH transport system permease protein|uniref:STAS domain-containing protein n=1 Tax=Oleidesulfovibrio alaskensis (strain ATCC BAA-1058 / DSM 17464 / G20) TaxID=207559 RepID=Q30ZW4_OLEA2|nr:ABC transporter permease [Oleidesulfovibrio alaskensis]ABB38782.1 protein of unknown function DUF140 [Oleidesulfovibrio alaskensis G20]MBG0773087.1 ABC transporter permease [Oleidesulfovibrio alaskensis]